MYSPYIDEGLLSDPEVIEQGVLCISSDCQLVLYFYGDYADLSLYYEKCRAGLLWRQLYTYAL